jgi:hypothetical protein
MSASIIACAIWALCATAVAFMPMRVQYVLGSALLLAAPILIGWIWRDFGWIAGVAVLVAVGSMFRKPLVFWGRKALGRTSQ